MNLFDSYVKNYNKSFGEAKEVLSDAVDPSFENYSWYDRSADVVSGLLQAATSPVNAFEATFIEDPIVDYAVAKGADADRTRAYVQMGLAGTGILMGGMQAIGKADDLANVAKRMVSDKTQRELADLFPGQKGIWGGKNADFAPPLPSDRQLRKYDKMNPVQREHFRRKTGWLKGPDGQPRFEIDDSKMEVKFEELSEPAWKRFSEGKKEIITIGDVVKHDELFNQYPELKSIPLKIQSSRPDTSQGSYLPYKRDPDFFRKPMIEITPMEGKNMSEWGRDKNKKTLLHELQHAVQQIEDFYKGTNTESVLKEVDRYGESIQKLNRMIENTDKKFSKAQLNVLKKRRDGLYDVYTKAMQEGEIMPNEAYMRSFGEMEARAAEDRMDLVPTLRQNIRPRYDRPLEQHIPIKHKRGQTGRWIDDL